MKTILLIEDDQILGSSIQEALQNAGFEVGWGKESSEGFRFLDEHYVDLILLDIMLPGEDGYQILKKLKADNSKYRATPVVMLTNLGQYEEMKKAMEMGARDYLIKANLDLVQLVALVKDRVELH